MKKLFTTLAVGALSLTLLSGCSTGTTDSNTDGNGTSNAQSNDCIDFKNGVSAFKFVSVEKDEHGSYCHVTADSTILEGYEETGADFNEATVTEIGLTVEEAKAAVDFAMKYHVEVYLDNPYVDVPSTSAKWLENLSEKEKNAWFAGWDTWGDLSSLDKDNNSLIYTGRVPELIHSTTDARFTNSGFTLDKVESFDDPSYGKMLNIYFTSSVNYQASNESLLGWVDSYGDKYYQNIYKLAGDKESANTAYNVTQARYALAKTENGWRIGGWEHIVNDLHHNLEYRKSTGKDTTEYFDETMAG